MPLTCPEKGLTPDLSQPTRDTQSKIMMASRPFTTRQSSKLLSDPLTGWKISLDLSQVHLLQAQAFLGLAGDEEEVLLRYGSH